MLKTPAFLMGLFGGNEMYVVAPGTTKLTERNSSTAFQLSTDILLVKARETNSGGLLKVTYPNKTSCTFPIGSSGTDLYWPIAKGSTLSGMQYLYYVPLVPAKSGGGGKPLLSSVLRKVRELRERFADLFASVRYGYAD